MPFFFFHTSSLFKKKFLWRPNVTFILEKKDKNARTLFFDSNTVILVKERKEREESLSPTNAM